MISPLICRLRQLVPRTSWSTVRSREKRTAKCNSACCSLLHTRTGVVVLAGRAHSGTQYRRFAATFCAPRRKVSPGWAAQWRSSRQSRKPVKQSSSACVWEQRPKCTASLAAFHASRSEDARRHVGTDVCLSHPEHMEQDDLSHSSHIRLRRH